ncbi:MAG: patatin-like phospholipase family protein [Spirochaetia bacterium]|nr:patatin-like phospholipase family protein [Spirochaetia bacterium]
MPDSTLRVYLLLFFLLSSLLLCAEEGVLNDSLFSAAEPIIHGEQTFIERVKHQAGDQEPVALVLSGGSARAFSHIGVLQALEEQGIIPDLIVSNSMGSIVGLLYGAGLSPAQIHELVSSINIGDLFSLTIPLEGGLLDIKAFTDSLYHILGDLRLEHLPIPVLVVCEDLKTKQPIYLVEGDFYTAMEASFALPVYFSPVSYRDHLLIDGGITNLLHLDAAYRYTDTVITSTAFYDNPDLNLKNPFTILNVSLDIGKRRAGVTDLLMHDPLLIRSAVESFSFMDFQSLDAIYQAGYEAASQHTELFSTLAARTPNAGQLARRLVFDQSFPQRLTERSAFGFIPVKEPRSSLNLHAWSQALPYDDTPFSDDLMVSALYRIDSYASVTSFDTGLALDLYESWNMRAFLRAEHIWYPTKNLKSSSYGYLSLVPDLSAIDETSAGTAIDLLLLNSEAFRFELYANGHLRMQGLFQSDYAALSSGFRSVLSLAPRAALQLSAGYRLEDLEVSAVEAELHGAFTAAGSQLLLGLDTTVLIPFSPNDTVHFFRRDQFRSQISEGTYDQLLGSSVTLRYRPFSDGIPLAELMMISKLSGGIYGDVLWTDTLSWGTGILLDASVSLIGLESTHLQFYAGYDSSTTGLTWGLLFGLELLL